MLLLTQLPQHTAHPSDKPHHPIHLTYCTRSTYDTHQHSKLRSSAGIARQTQYSVHTTNTSTTQHTQLHSSVGATTYTLMCRLSSSEQVAVLSFTGSPAVGVCVCVRVCACVQVRVHAPSCVWLCVCVNPSLYKYGEYVNVYV